MICATVAFGMGVNCPDVRVIIHIGDVESYIQETGRASAGWDDQPSAILFTKKRHSINKDMRLLLFKYYMS